MGRLIFISHEQMEKLIGEGVADINNDDIVLRLERTYVGKLKDAYFFVRNVVDPQDRRGLVGKVMIKEEIKELNADIMQDSIIIGDDAYDVEEGFLVSEQGTGEVKDTKKGSRTQEIKSLASFLLNNLRSEK